MEHDLVFADDWEGPEIPGLGRRLKASEARLFHRRAGLTPDEAVVWTALHLGPYDAERAIARGLDAETYLVWRAENRASRVVDDPTRAADDKGWLDAGFTDAAAWRRFTLEFASADPAGVTLEVPFGFSATDARAWSDAGFEPQTAARWALLGLNPMGAAVAVGQGADPTTVDLDTFDENWTAVWDVVGTTLHVLLLRDMWWLVDEAVTGDSAQTAPWAARRLEEGLRREVLAGSQRPDGPSDHHRRWRVHDFDWVASLFIRRSQPLVWAPERLTKAISPPETTAEDDHS